MFNINFPTFHQCVKLFLLCVIVFVISEESSAYRPPLSLFQLPRVGKRYDDSHISAPTRKFSTIYRVGRSQPMWSLYDMQDKAGELIWEDGTPLRKDEGGMVDGEMLMKEEALQPGLVPYSMITSE